MGGALAALAVAVIGVSLAHPKPAGSQVNAFGLAAPLAVPSPDSAGESNFAPSVPTPQGPRGNPFARAKGVALWLPAPNPVGIAYHEASFDWALPLHPLGRLKINGNAWKYDAPSDSPGRRYIVMFSRGRSTPATSAVDFVMHRSTPARSPVSGTVVDVHEYHLYCRYPDMSVTIAPQGHPRMGVVLIHLDRVQVQPGDRVFATLSVLGYPRVFGFGSQVDDYFEGGNPHVHIEITKPHKARRATC